MSRATLAPVPRGYLAAPRARIGATQPVDYAGRTPPVGTLHRTTLSNRVRVGTPVSTLSRESPRFGGPAPTGSAYRPALASSSSGTPRSYGSDLSIRHGQGSSLSAAGRLHASLLSERSASSAGSEAYAPTERLKSSFFGAAHADRHSHSASAHSGSDVRRVLPYGCTMVDSSSFSQQQPGGGALQGSSHTCDKCDGKHPTSNCPHYRQSRDNHPDALVRAPTSTTGEVSDGSLVVLIGARVHSQPGDGNCLFHSLAHGLGDGSSAGSLRREIASFIEQNGDLEIGGNSLSQWVRWDSGSSVPAYARRMSASGCWGGGIEIAAVSKLRSVNVSVFEPDRISGTLKRIGAFVYSGSKHTVHVLYRGGVHYDAIEGGTLKTVVPPTARTRL